MGRTLGRRFVCFFLGNSMGRGPIIYTNLKSIVYVISMLKCLNSKAFLYSGVDVGITFIGAGQYTHILIGARKETYQTNQIL